MKLRPIELDGERADALRFGDARVQAQLLGLDPVDSSAARMTYDRRLALFFDLAAALGSAEVVKLHAPCR